jgi:uncharacterized protein YjiS (DUF1127 family)
MSTMCLDRAPARTSVPAIPPRPALGARLLAGLLSVRSVAARELRIRRARRALEEMPDNLLSDIGLSRGDIDHALRNGRPWRDREGGVRR